MFKPNSPAPQNTLVRAARRKILCDDEDETKIILTPLP